jgi:hypothetical protein
LNFYFYFLIEILIRTYEDILEMNINSSKNASASIDDEQKFQVVCYKKRNSKLNFSFSLKILLMHFL